MSGYRWFVNCFHIYPLIVEPVERACHDISGRVTEYRSNCIFHPANLESQDSPLKQVVTLLFEKCRLLDIVSCVLQCRSFDVRQSDTRAKKTCLPGVCKVFWCPDNKWVWGWQPSSWLGRTDLQISSYRKCSRARDQWSGGLSALLWSPYICMIYHIHLIAV